MDRSTLHLALRELRAHFADLRVLGIMAVVAIVLGFAGPFGTFDAMPTLPRLAYWAATVGLTYAAGLGLSMLVDRLWGEGKPLWLRVVLMTIAATIGTTLTVTLINLVAFGTAYFNWGAMLTLTLQCAAVSLGVVTVGLLLDRKPLVAAEAGPPAILDRVPVHLRGALLALIVEDHYVDIVTAKGKTLVLMRLADAIRETGSVAGLQIHRSHWVAREAVVKAHRSTGKVELELSNGLKLPVSRGYLGAAKEAGLL